MYTLLDLMKYLRAGPASSPGQLPRREKPPFHHRIALRLKRDVIAHAYNALASPFYGAVTRVGTDEPCVALTFDDGPDPHWTPQVLEVLAKHGARATFFCVGRSVAKHREVVEAAVRAGHVVGSHTDSHASLTSLSAGDVAEEIRAGHEALGDLASPLFRPPFGHYDLKVARAVKSQRVHCVLWESHVGDWLPLPQGELARRIRCALRPGAVVLLHDAVISPAPGVLTERTRLLAALDEVLSTNEDGFRFVTVPELMEKGRTLRAMFDGGLVHAP